VLALIFQYFDVGKRPTWRHLLIRDDPTDEFEPGQMPDGALRRGIDGRDRRPGPGVRNGMI